MLHDTPNHFELRAGLNLMNCWHLQFGVEGNIGGDLVCLLNCGGAVAAWFKCTRLQIKLSRFLSRQATLHCALEQDTLLSQCLSLPWCINRYW